MAYTSKPLAFPKVKKLSELFSSITPRRYGMPGYKPSTRYYGKAGLISSFCSGGGRGNSYDVTPKQAVIDYIEKSMFPIYGGSVYFEIVKRDDGSKLVLVKYDQIIGSRYLALIPKAKKKVPAKKGGAKKKLRRTVKSKQSSTGPQFEVYELDPIDVQGTGRGWYWSTAPVTVDSKEHGPFNTKAEANANARKSLKSRSRSKFRRAVKSKQSLSLRGAKRGVRKAVKHFTRGVSDGLGLFTCGVCHAFHGAAALVRRHEAHCKGKK